MYPVLCNLSPPSAFALTDNTNSLANKSHADLVPFRLPRPFSLIIPGPSIQPQCSKDIPTSASIRTLLFNSCPLAHSRVFLMSIATVIGPTPPGTGVIQPATSETLAKSTSPTREWPDFLEESVSVWMCVCVLCVCVCVLCMAPCNKKLYVVTATFHLT